MVGLILVVAALCAACFASHQGGLPRHIVVRAGTMRQFTYSHLFGHIVACANGGQWKVTPLPKPLSTPQVRVVFIADGYVDVFCSP